MSSADRYSRQRRLRVIGEEGQGRLEVARVAVVGLGALGSTAAECLVRSGVGKLTLIDRDVLELSNLQRQFLYDETDVEEKLPKAVAAKRRLSLINSSVTIETHVENLHSGNIESLLDGVQVIIDGTDNLETRYLVNDYSVQSGVPWIYGGAIGTSGTGLFILPERGPCLRCIFTDPPDAQKLGTCDTVGVLGAVPVIIGAWQAGMTIRFIVAGAEGIENRMLMLDLWEHGFQEPAVRRKKDCPACVNREFPFLEFRKRTTIVRLCGSGAFQVTPPERKSVQIELLAKRLEGLGDVELTPFYLGFSDGRVRMIVFGNGGARVQGAETEKEALSFYARYIGQ